MHSVQLTIDGAAYTCTPVGTQPAPPLTAYAQNGQSWSSHHMGGVPQTIGGYGCAMVCACMVYSVVEDIAPGEFNKLLTSAGGYNIVNGNEAHLAWDRLPAILTALEWLGRANYTSLLTDSELDHVFEMIDEAPLILWVDFKPSVAGMQTHFVLATGHTDDDIEILDPWGGVKDTLMRRYGSEKPGDSLRRAVWGYRQLVARAETP